jgi:beta-galactosidase
MCQAQWTGIETIKFDVPDGDYEIVLHFAELIIGETNNDLIFNIGWGTTR